MDFRNLAGGGGPQQPSSLNRELSYNSIDARYDGSSKAIRKVSSVYPSDSQGTKGPQIDPI